MKQGILEDYLKRKGSEVVNMLTAEYDYNLDIEVQREEAEAIGEKRGEKQFAELAKRLLQDARSNDLLKAASDDALKEKLYQEYGIR